MIASRRAVGLATACCVMLAAGAATAQTVIVTGAPPQSTVELALNANVIQKGAAGEDSTATLTMNLTEVRGRSSTDVHIVVDSCADRYLVALVEPPLQPPAATEGCDRRELVGLFLIQQVTTMVVYVGDAAPSVRVKQGSVPREWLAPGAREAVAAAPENIAPRGLVLSAGGGWAVFGSPTVSECGSVSDCSGKESPMAVTAAATFWLNQILGAEVSYVKPGQVTASGSGNGFTFNTGIETDIVTIVGKIGVPARAARVYGFGGATHHWATTTTTEQIADQTVTVDDQEVVLPGGTQVFKLNTKGWSWLFGGGVEAWVSRRFAIYGDITYLKLRGDNADGGDGSIDDHATLLMMGARVKLF